MTNAESMGITTTQLDVRLINYQGDDEQICDAARVSFANDAVDQDFETKYKKDVRLLNYLAKHNHWSPFAHNSITLRITAPIFLARQLVKHQVGGVWNEISRRYVDSTPSFYVPMEYHMRPKNAKQGSGAMFDYQTCWEFQSHIREHCYEALELYEELLEKGVAPEEARMVLPLNMMTSWYWTGSLAFFFRVYKQRNDGHAQLVAQEFAQKLKDIIEPLFPEAWKALEDANG